MSGIVTLALNPSIDISSDANSVRTAHKVRTSNETYDPGGGGVNVARVIAELGGDVEALYLAGGFTGSLLDDLLERDRVCRRLIRIAGNTRISFTVHERTTGLEYRFVASGPTLQEEELGVGASRPSRHANSSISSRAAACHRELRPTSTRR